MDKKVSEIKEDRKGLIQGVVTARKCDCCAHHEIGVITNSGKYISLKPGMKIKVIEER